MRHSPDAPQAAALEALHHQARELFTHALDACSIERAIDQHLSFEGTTMVVHPSRLLERIRKPHRIELSHYSSIVVIAFGKAAATMVQALLQRLPRGVRVRGMCSAPQRLARRMWRFRSFVGGHPLPNEDSFAAARTALRLLRKTNQRTLVMYLISGGGSTMLELPLDPSISLEDTVAFHEALIGCGASIAEINTLRKHFSAVKGGRLAMAAPCADKLTLQIADTPLRHLDAVASGPTLPDRTTVADCRALIAKYPQCEKFPASVQAFFSRPDMPETPGDKPSPDGSAQLATAADNAFNGLLDTLLSNHDLVNAARERARSLGYRVFIDNTCDDWPWDRAAAYLVERLRVLRHDHPRLCLLSGGEVTVRLSGTPGTGGRNQQFALACALLMARDLPQANVVCLSAGSDGSDGNSPAAGAIADPTTVGRAQAFGYDPQKTLAAFDACPLFTALGDTLVTGATGNNLRDLRILISTEAEGKVSSTVS